MNGKKSSDEPREKHEASRKTIRQLARSIGDAVEPAALALMAYTISSVLLLSLIPTLNTLLLLFFAEAVGLTAIVAIVVVMVFRRQLRSRAEKLESVTAEQEFLRDLDVEINELLKVEKG